MPRELQIWICESCTYWTRSDPTAGDDWGGEEEAVGPMCPHCDEEMIPGDATAEH